MILIKTIQQAVILSKNYRANGSSIGFVPTMGALHAGHIALIQNCKKVNEVCVCSIFINPAQFNNSSDFEKYPVTIEKDIDMLEAAGCDLLFLPSVPEIYPDGAKPVKYPLGYLETILEGKFRPGHFQGVCQVVDKLLSIIMPDELFLGQKDYQQFMVIKKLIRFKKYQIKVKLVPTVRETNGLAMSSRNMRLTAGEKQKAVLISQALVSIKKELKPGNVEALKEKMKAHLQQNDFKADYVEIANAATLEPLKIWDGKTAAVALIAASINEVRLIDNLILTGDDDKMQEP